MADAFDDAFAAVAKLEEGKEPDASFGKDVAAPATPAVAEETEIELPKPSEGEEEPPIPGATGGDAPPALDDAAVERLLAGLASRVPPPAPRTPMPDAPRQPQLVTQEEAQFLQGFYQEWPDVARANEVMLRVARQTIEQRVYAEMAAVLRPKLDMIDALATRAQLQYFESAVPEYDQIAEKIGPWVDQQPQYLRAAYSNVMQNGTEDEVLDLINRYKQATGTVAQTPPLSPAQKATELSPTAKQAAARLAPVRSARTTATTQAAATDFDAAFVEALKSI